MRLSDVLSKQPQDYKQVDDFLTGKKGAVGQQAKIDVGNIALNYFCKRCDDLRTFRSNGKLTAIFINKSLISIDAVLSCDCGATVQTWFLVECNKDITEASPLVRILKKTERMSENVRESNNDYGDFSELLSKAQKAYKEGLGAGALVYLRKVFETVTVQTANAINIEYAKFSDGNPKNFSDLLKRVDQQSSIIPQEFSEDGYRLYRELSGVVHGNFNEELGLRKFDPLYRLVVGILDNVNSKQEFQEAKAALGWCDEESVLV